MVNFRGFFLPKERDSNEDRADSEDDSESDNDNFENPDYRDIIQIASGEYKSYSPSRIRCVTERLQELEERNGRFVLTEEKVVRARFDSMFTQPWWMVEVMQFNTASRTLRPEKIPSYSIRCDDGVDKSLLSLFLTRGCCVNEQHVASLLEFFEGRNLRMTFVDLLDNLREFSASGEGNSEIAKQIRRSLASNATGKAFQVPELTKVVHCLFPRHARTLFSSSSLEVLQDIQQALQSEPWIFGYQAVLQESFGISGVEVKLPAFINCNLLETMPVVQRDALYIYNALCKLIHKYGHTYVPLWQLKFGKWYTVPFTPRAYHVTKWQESLTYLSKINAAKTAGNAYGDGCPVFLPNIRGYEQTIVRSICKIMKMRPWVSDVEIDEKVFGGDEDQVKAARLMTSTPVVVMSGRGGCGKTHVVSTVLSGELKVKRSQIPVEQLTIQDERATSQCSESFAGDCQTSQINPGATTAAFSSSSEITQEEISLSVSQNSGIPQSQIRSKDPSDDAVLLTAPTGRASSILGKRTGIQAYTLHSVIFSYFRWLKEVKNGEDHSAWRFSGVKLLVCDESSLISVKAFSTLIKILMRKAALQQIILLGDKNQLPSIEPGNFLNDVYQALEPYGCSITLRTNHRAESQVIVENASRISHQEMPWFHDDPGSRFISLCCQSKQGTDENVSDDMVITQVVKDLLDNKTVKLPEPQRSQFIAFRRRDCLNINELCAQHYNKHPIKNSKGRLDFQTGDKVCVRRNIMCFDAYTREDVKFSNGEIFFITDIIEEEDNHNVKTTYLALDNGERIVKVDMKMLKSAKLRHAWARTIHTYQGSEIDTVVYVLGSPIYQDWRHVYTAVTRGVQQVIVIHDPNHLKKVVTVNKPFQRRTKLGEFLTKNLSTPSISDDEESDPEIDMLRGSPSASAGNNENDDSFHSQSVGTGYSPWGRPASSAILEMTHSSDHAAAGSTNTSQEEAWEDELQDECDDEILAWALECSQQVTPEVSTSCPDPQMSNSTERSGCYQPSTNVVKETSEYLFESSGPHGNSITAVDFHISRNNLNIKKERRYSQECGMQENCHSSATCESNQNAVPSNGFLRSRNGVRVKIDQQDKKAELDMVKGSNDQFFGSLSDLISSRINVIPASVEFHQTANGLDSPKAHSRRFTETFSFPTPPQTPPNIGNAAPFSSRHLSQTFPRKRSSKRTPSITRTRIQAKSRRRSVTAKFDSVCKLCNSPINAGLDEIVQLDIGSAKPWVHQKCVHAK